MVETSSGINCNISPSQYTFHQLSSTVTEPRQDQFLIHIHGWPHTGTGFLRQKLHQSLNEILSGFSSIQDSSLNNRKRVVEDEGQYMQNMYPQFNERRVVYERGSRPVAEWMQDYGKLQYLADSCTFNYAPISKDNGSEVGKILFGQWSQYWNMSATFLLQKTPLLDVLFLERVKIIPTLHLFIVRHPMSFFHMKQEQGMSCSEDFGLIISLSYNTLLLHDRHQLAPIQLA